MKKRLVFDKLWAEIDSPDILVLLGARQVGKTTLMLLLKEKLENELKVHSENILFYDLEGLSDRQIWENQTLVEKRLSSGESLMKKYIFIDEFQKVPQITSVIKYLHDHFPNLKFILSGSSSIAINALLTESMLGRKRDFLIYPLALEEFFDFKNSSQEKEIYKNFMENSPITPAENNILNLILKEFITFGAYPKIVLLDSEEAKKEELKNIINTYLLKDIQLLVKQKMIPAFEKILGMIAAQDGMIMNVSRFSQDLKINQQTISRYLQILKYTYLLNFLPAFSRKASVEIRKMGKVYLLDTGFKNILIGNFSYLNDATASGSSYENFAINEINKHLSVTDKIFYWRTKNGQEVDLILKRESLIIPVEIKSGTENHLPSGLKSFIKKYRPQKAFVLNKDIMKKEIFENCEIEWLPIWAAKKVLAK